MEQINEGSGFVFSKTDTTTYIATCEYVVGECPELIVVSTDSEEYEPKALNSLLGAKLTFVKSKSILALAKEYFYIPATGVIIEYLFIRQRNI